MLKSIFRLFANFVFGIRKFNNNKIKEYAKNISNKKILEIGSGQHTHGENFYSAKQYFNDNNDFIQSDVNPDFGHKVVDLTILSEENEYDIILCLNVLEHVFEYEIAITNLARALRSQGELIVLVPAFYPLHDEPYDFWRFTEHSLKRMFPDFIFKSFEHKGIRQFATAYFMVLEKK